MAVVDAVVFVVDHIPASGGREEREDADVAVAWSRTATAVRFAGAVVDGALLTYIDAALNQTTLLVPLTSCIVVVEVVADHSHDYERVCVSKSGSTGMPMLLGPIALRSPVFWCTSTAEN